MNDRAAPRGERMRKARRWAGLSLLAFLAGLFSVGVIVFLPGGDVREEGGISPFAGPPGPAGPPPSQTPAGPPPRVPELAIVVDDFGYDPSRDAEWLSFPEKITVAVIPFGPSSRRIAESAKNRGFGVIIHAPMEPEGEAPDRTEAFRLRRGMDAQEIAALLSRMAADIPQATGVSNHMGSAFTSDLEAMDLFAQALKSKGLFLLDSVTSPRSVAAEAARRAGVPVLRRDVFLDAEGGGDLKAQLQKAVAAAVERGGAVAICHARPETLRTLLDLLPDVRKAGVRIVTLDDLVGGAEG